MMLAENNALAICHHEAGHAVAAIVYGLDLIGASVVSTPTELGRVCYSRRTVQRLQLPHIKKLDAIVASCGPIAESVFTGKSVSECGSGIDFERVRYRAIELGRDRKEQLAIFRDILTQGIDLVHGNLRAIEAIAGSLAERHVLNNSQLKRLYQLNRGR